MTPDEILQRMVDLRVKTFDLDPALVVPQARLREDLDIDSIDAVDLMVQLKPMVGQRLQPEAFKTVRTVNDVADALYKLVSGEQVGA